MKKENIKELIESDKGSDEIVSILEAGAKVGGVLLAPDVIKSLSSAGFKEMKDFRSFADAPKGTYILELSDATILVSPYKKGPLVEAYWDGAGQSGVAMWNEGSAGMSLVGRIKSLIGKLKTAKTYEEFTKVVERFSPSQLGY
ncbi:hypothetical protein Molly5_185 [Maribacter phage Molly_5]|uniref:Uncharacterized protein n=1 Tax=Maribacter phage Molly_1 TaxID=2745685 RepID=A0A8E4UYB1_9CAUD|nr:hypothetical protein M1M29_gp185 [Maribacter phage Molly_1]QQO97683.1 hypothetical protein Molly2_185 [Maribacter phage Molly_2]QQO97883.1 hypothetical protein Molly3_185 [Maribacter phage Molly_3]QQO98083.1 hypothetical protein Molly4_185 [Maribacter phage Molly_4]QQO98283.1 hypothetical protein Molly5_185 [Maribacter phage Molly_5]QQO97483.1 hypothetical protein Molly1_185 [Maribacter phage Molly_1]